MHPEVSRARASVAALTRCVRAGERSPDDLLVAKADLENAKRSAIIDKLVDEAPLLSDEQRTKLAELLRPVRITTTDRKTVVAERLAKLDGGGDHAA